MNPENEIVIADVQRALSEDVGSGDVSAQLLAADLIAGAEIIAREPLLLCGIAWVDEVFKQINPSVKTHWLFNEGDWIDKPSTLCRITGVAKDILTAERSALNFLQTLSATATQTYHYVRQLQGTGTKLLDTRKTLPGLRYAQKYAVVCAGGVNHRMGLYDAFLIKENHIKACGSIAQAIKKARLTYPKLFVEVEVETLQELHEALMENPDRILLDNFTIEMLKQAVSINETYHCSLEASGGVDLKTIRSIAETGVDFISVGAITKSIQAIDLSLLIRNIK